MQRPPFLNSKLMFQDFPKELIIKTYLGSRILVILRWESKLVIWKEDNIFIRLSEIDLQASKDEIQDKHNKVCEFCEEFNRKNKPKKAKKMKANTATTGMYEWADVISGRIGYQENSSLPPQFSQETLDDIAEGLHIATEHVTTELERRL